jgi:hypothetical protein
MSGKSRLNATPLEDEKQREPQFGELIRKEYAKWGEVVKRSGARID